MVGFSENSVGYIDISGLQVKNDFIIDCEPWDIALGENGWCYITSSGYSWVYFRSLNLETGELVVGTTWGMIYEKTVIKKLKSKPYLLGSRMTTSPSGILLFNISNGAACDTITYYHTNLGPFMVPEDGARIYTQDGTVYGMPVANGLFNPQSPPVLGQLQTSTPYFSTFEELKSRGSILGVVLYNYMDEDSFPIDEFNVYTFNKIRTFNAAPVYIIENGKGTLYPVKPEFIFADKEGSMLFVVKNIIPVYNKNYWTVEAIQLN